MKPVLNKRQYSRFTIYRRPWPSTTGKRGMCWAGAKSDTGCLSYLYSRTNKQVLNYGACSTRR